MKKTLVTMAVAFGVLVATAGSAYAGTGTGKIQRVYTAAPNLIFVNMETVAGQPFCASAAEFAIDPGTPIGKNTYALLLTAYALGVDIHIEGSNDCTVKGDRESISYAILL